MVVVTRTRTVLQENARMAHVLIPMARFAKAKNAFKIAIALQDVAMTINAWTSLIKGVDAMRRAIANLIVAKPKNGEERSIASDH